jgi:imidazolonepropionase
MRPDTGAYGAVEDGVVAIDGSTITWGGAAADAPTRLVSNPAADLDAGGGWITPGLLDVHTHLLFGGTRADEFEMRLAGTGYEEIARRGGGILSTVRATRDASDDELESRAAARIDHLRAHGVTTVEIKSGYGLDLEAELRMLRIARRLGEGRPVTVRTTLLGAHALPPEFAADRDAFVALVCEEMIPAAARGGLADAVDAFCEGIAFTADECERVLRAGAAYGLAGRLHADQLSDLSGAELAARVGARSADHLEHASEAGVRAMAAAGTTAVLLPGAFHFLSETRAPPIEAFRRHGVPMAVATDLNPGSSPVASPLVALNLASVLFGLTPEEALSGMTRHAAPVLGMERTHGVLASGFTADLAVWDVDRPSELAYWLGANPCRAVVKDGIVVR